MIAPLLAAPLSIRWREPGDSVFLERLAGETLTEFSRGAAEDTLGMARRAPTFIATRRDAPIGFAIIELKRETAHLQAIAVVERERGHGVGQVLLEAAEEYARTRGARRISLHTAQANVAALSLFLKDGFRIEARLSRFYRGVYDACHLTKTW